jgi:hypothetical protein
MKKMTDRETIVRAAKKALLARAEEVAAVNYLASVIGEFILDSVGHDLLPENLADLFHEDVKDFVAGLDVGSLSGGAAEVVLRLALDDLLAKARAKAAAVKEAEEEQNNEEAEDEQNNENR